MSSEVVILLDFVPFRSNQSDEMVVLVYPDNYRDFVAFAGTHMQRVMFPIPIAIGTTKDAQRTTKKGPRIHNGPQRSDHEVHEVVSGSLDSLC